MNTLESPMRTLQHMIKWSFYTTAFAGMLLLTGVASLLAGLEMLILLVEYS